jgi:exoribonuclease-2
VAQLVEYLTAEGLAVGLVKEQSKKKVVVEDRRGRAATLAPAKVLFRHSAASAEELTARLEALQQEVDVPLLWASVQEEHPGAVLEAGPLARLYFDEDSDAHRSAVFRALSDDRLHFRRKGHGFEPRSPAELRQLQQQRDADRRAAEQRRALRAALEQGRPDDALARRLLRYLRGTEDRPLARALEELRGAADLPRKAFRVLAAAGRLPATAAFEEVRADLRAEHPPEVEGHVQALEPPPPAPEGELWQTAFAIDDPETREVDDALTVSPDGDGLRLEIDIADAALQVQPDDPVDREACRRATTVYLPTGTYYMLPERLGCELASLGQGQARPVVRTTVRLDAAGQVTGHTLCRGQARLGRRLDYETADRLLAGERPDDPAAPMLALLDRAARALRALRVEAGALLLRRREWKIRVSGEGAEIQVKPIPADSPSRAAVAEMMILANGLAAREAAERGIPIIFRVQPPPDDPLPPLDLSNPASFEALRGRLKPAALSLHPDRHWGLGLEAYAQVTSPLRRYADLVVQRQLTAALDGRPPPCQAQALMQVLATAEATEREVKRIEEVVTERWALEYVSRLERRTGLEATVLGANPGGGYRVQLEICGARGVLVDDRAHDPGQRLLVDVKTVRPRKGTLRLTPAD